MDVSIFVKLWWVEVEERWIHCACVWPHPTPTLPHLPVSKMERVTGNAKSLLKSRLSRQSGIVLCGVSQQHYQYTSISLHAWCKYKHWWGLSLSLFFYSSGVLCMFGSFRRGGMGGWPKPGSSPANALCACLLYSEISENQNIANAQQAPTLVAFSVECHSASVKQQNLTQTLMKRNAFIATSRWFY